MSKIIFSQSTNAGDIVNVKESLLNATFSGPFDTPQQVAVLLRKFNKFVVCEIAGISATQGSAVTVATSDAIIPAEYRPQAAVFLPIPIINNNLLPAGAGKLEIGTDGVIKIHANLVTTGLFSILAANGWQRTCLSWCTAS